MIQKKKKEILNVTIEDVKSISKKIKIDTIYLLHGVMQLKEITINKTNDVLYLIH